MAKSFKTASRKAEKKSNQHTIRPVAALIYLIIAGMASASNMVFAASDIEFNSDILDLKDKQNIDLSDFSRAGYIMPGKYEFIVKVNNNELPVMDMITSNIQRIEAGEAPVGVVDMQRGY